MSSASVGASRMMDLVFLALLDEKTGKRGRGGRGVAGHGLRSLIRVTVLS